MVPIGGTPPCSLELGDSSGQLRAGAMTSAGGFQDTGAKIFRDELHFVGGEAAYEAPRPGAERSVSTSNQRGDQFLTLGNHTNDGDLRRIITKTHIGRKG